MLQDMCSESRCKKIATTRIAKGKRIPRHVSQYHRITLIAERNCRRYSLGPQLPEIKSAPILCVHVKREETTSTSQRQSLPYTICLRICRLGSRDHLLER